MKLTNLYILVTGGAGFIGSALVRFLLRDMHGVVQRAAGAGAELALYVLPARHYECGGDAANAVAFSNRKALFL